MHRALKALLIVGLIGTLALATATNACAMSEPPAEDLLAGPKVDEAAEQQSGGMISEDRRRAADAMRISHQQWMGRVRELQLDNEQRRSMRAINEEMIAANEKFMQELSDDDRALLNRARGDRQAAPEMSESPERMRQRLQAIEERRPKPEPYQQRIWELLTSDQQVQMKAALDAMRQDMLQRQQQRRERRNAEASKSADAMADQAMSPQMQNPGDAMMEQPQTAERPQRARPARPRLDQMAERRLQFLIARQTGPNQIHIPKQQPTEEDRQFNFEGTTSD